MVEQSSTFSNISSNQKIAFVTGASRGIGKCIALQLAQNGYHLGIICQHNRALLEKVKNECEAYGVICSAYAGDIGNPDFIKETVEDIQHTIGPISVVVNNAGISYIGLLTDMTFEDWNTVLHTNLTSVFNSCHSIVPSMVAQKRGRILNISSVWGSVGASCEVAYSATKGGINAFTKALAKELAPSGITVNALSLGTIDTDMNRCFSDEERKALEEEIPMGRYGTPEEVAKFALSILEAPDYLTGQIITMDGGWC